MAAAMIQSIPPASDKAEGGDHDESTTNQAAEISHLKSAYVGKCRVIEDSGDYKYVITIQPGNFDATIKFQLRAAYPSVIPDLVVRSSSLTTEQLRSLKDSLSAKAKELIDTPMIENLIRHTCTNLLAFGLKSGKVNKVNNDKIVTDSNAKKRIYIKKRCLPKTEDDIDEEKKKPMKTADDVIKRILWDEHLDKDDFLVGYIDRFLGLQEKYFSAFSWEDLASVDYNVLAVPQHRIQYFKYKTVKVWDKPRRVDNVFGSTEGAKTIDVIIKEFEERELRLRNAEDEQIREEETSDESDDESDDDDIVITIQQSVNIGSKKNPSNSNPPNEDKSPGDESTNANDDDYDKYWRDKLRPNYFMCVRITDPSIVDSVGEVHDHILEREPMLGECCIPGASLHITLCTLGLDTAEQLVHCMNSLNKMKSELKANLPTSTLRLHGVSHFYKRVVYAKVNYGNDFMDFCNVLKLSLREAGIDIRDGYEFVPHMTLMKTTRPVSRLRGSKNIDPAMYEPFLQKHFGEQKFTSIHLCSMSSERRDDGFYMTPLELDLL